MTSFKAQLAKGTLALMTSLMLIIGFTPGVVHAHAVSASTPPPAKVGGYTKTVTIPLSTSECAKLVAAYPKLADQPCVETMVLQVSAPHLVSSGASRSALPFDQPCYMYQSNWSQKYYAPARYWLAEQSGTYQYNDCNFGEINAQNCYRYNYALMGITLDVTNCVGVGTSTVEMDWNVSGGAGQQAYWQTTSTDIFGNLTQNDG